MIAEAAFFPAVIPGVGESIVEYSKTKGVDLVSLGSRGMGMVKR